MAKETFDRIKPGEYYPPPPNVGFLNLDITVTAGVLNVVNLTFSGSTSATWYALAYLSPSFSAGKMRASKSELKFLNAEAVPGTPFIQDLATKYQARFGVPNAGAKIFCTVLLVDIDSGSSVVLGSLSTIVVEV